MSSTGWEAYTIGFTLVGCIVACAGLGWWLDKQFGTSFCLPVLFLIGVAGGFREMFVVIGRISKAQEQQRKENAANERVVAKNLPQAHPLSTEQAQAPPRPRVFEVPPPPNPGEKVVPFEKKEDETESVEQLIERLLEDGKSDSEPEDEPPNAKPRDSKR